VIDGACSGKVITCLNRAVLAEEKTFRPARVNYRELRPAKRSSKVRPLPSGDTTQLLLDEVLKIAGENIGIFGLPLGRYECIQTELVVHGGGDFFETHKDVDDDRRNRRVLTGILYFAPDISRFQGGDLLLFSCNADGSHHPDDPPTRISPRPNRLVLFPSDQWHCVAKVSAAPDTPFAALRHSLNIWFTLAN
jgi:Rps23 Pro-64 3,4-dihydroxylase Tpa1-like proline 4-hydroxylase